MSVVVGIDPGRGGAIAWVSARRVQAVRLPYSKDGRPDCAALAKLIGTTKPIVVIERQFHVPHRRGEEAKLVGYGTLYGALKMLASAVHEVTWEEWQDSMAPGAPKSDKTDRLRRKRFLVACAKRRFPELDFDEHSGIADALLIAEYWRIFILNGATQ